MGKKNLVSRAMPMNKKSNKTPPQANNGTIQKNYVYLRGENIKYTKTNCIYNCTKVEPKIRLCFVRVKRVKNIYRSGDCDEIKNIKHFAAIQNKHNKVFANQHPAGNILEFKNDSYRPQLLSEQNEVKSNNETNIMDYSNATKHPNRPFTVQANAEFSVVLKKCVVRVQKLEVWQKGVNGKYEEREALLTSQIISPTLDHVKRDAFRKLSLTRNVKHNACNENFSQHISSAPTPESSNAILPNNSDNSYISSQKELTTSIIKTRPKRNINKQLQGKLGVSDIFTSENNNSSRMPLPIDIQNIFPSKNIALNQCLKSNALITRSKLQMNKNNRNKNENTPGTMGFVNRTRSLRVALRDVYNDHVDGPSKRSKNKQQEDSNKKNSKPLSSRTRSSINQLVTTVPTKNKKNIKSLEVMDKNNNKGTSVTMRLEDQTRSIRILLRDVKTDEVNGPTKSSKNHTQEDLNKKNSKLRSTTTESSSNQLVTTITTNSKNNKSSGKATNTKQPDVNSVEVEDPSKRTRIQIQEDSYKKKSKLHSIATESSLNQLVTTITSTSAKTTMSIFSTDYFMDTSDQIESHFDDDHQSTIQSVTKKVKGKSYILDFHPQRNSTMQCSHERKKSEINSDVTPIENVAGSQINRDAEVSNSMTHSMEQFSTKDNKTNRFFHRQDANNTSKHQVNSMITSKGPLLPKKSSQVRREHVYDFLSQSQTNDLDGSTSGEKRNLNADLAADIIQKLIAEGKAVVATRLKGKGRPVLKRQRIKKPKKTVKTKKVDKINNGNKVNIPNLTKKHQQFPINIVQCGDDHFAEDPFIDDDDDDESVSVGKSSNTQKHSSVVGVRGSYCHNAVQEGTFSNLARSVLLNQVERKDPQPLKARKLLHMAKKLISTPKNKNTPAILTAISTDLSPIPSKVQQQRLATKPSPWRVDEDAHLPRVFNFSRSSGNLPSFSCDNIPPTPRKENLNSTTLSKLADTIRPQAKFERSPLQQSDASIGCPLVSNGINSRISSFSSNDSTAENKTPPKRNGQSNDENANIFNLRHLPNPRKMLNYRSPLKAINIVEVVTLPPLEMLKVCKNKETSAPSTVENFEDLSNSQNVRHTNEKYGDLFGFEDFLSQTERFSQECNSNSTNDGPKTTSPFKVLNEKRHLLRKLKPHNSELQISLEQKTNDTRQKRANKNQEPFTGTRFVLAAQPTLKEMFKKNLHEEPATSVKVKEKLRHYSPLCNEEESNSSGMLFKDCEPETTFNEEEHHRTYLRPYKRKRRLNQTRLIVALESDDSDNEFEVKKKSNNNQSNDTDTSTEKQTEKKIKKKLWKEKPELVHFVESFNEMCKDVENYELIVEKSG